MTVAGHLQSTTNPAVYAAGDSADTPGMPLTPVAVFEGRVAASNMLKGTTVTPTTTACPPSSSLFPSWHRVGLLEEDAKANGIDVDVRYNDTSGWYSKYRVGETTAATKILIDKSTDTTVGAHMLRPEYGADQLPRARHEAPSDNTPTEVDDRVLPERRLGSRLGSML